MPEPRTQDPIQLAQSAAVWFIMKAGAHMAHRIFCEIPNKNGVFKPQDRFPVSFLSAVSQTHERIPFYCVWQRSMKLNTGA